MNYKHFLVSICLALTFCSKPAANTTALTPFTLSTTNDPRTPLYVQAKNVLSEAFEELGYDLFIITLPNKRSLSWANSGRVDGELFRVDSLDLTQLPNLVQVPEPIAIIDQSVIGNSDIKVNGWKSMKNLTIAYERGTAFLDKNQSRFKGIILVDDFEQAIELILAGRADITVTSKATAERLLKLTTNQSTTIRVHTPPLVEIRLHTYLNKDRHPNLAARLAETLKQMKADGRYQQLTQIH
ncbi:substrate-binding periplasmic protein [Pseudoalteromonas sp. T1lg65]|uniref:substrate-binding periplasmic protein n=1 Tax=Pseudoalteromonas sp. T1lg65 TaxID=2077101 RepID=UPI003F79CAE5